MSAIEASAQSHRPSPIFNANWDDRRECWNLYGSPAAGDPRERWFFIVDQPEHSNTHCSGCGRKILENKLRLGYPASDKFSASGVRTLYVHEHCLAEDIFEGCPAVKELCKQTRSRQLSVWLGKHVYGFESLKDKKQMSLAIGFRESLSFNAEVSSPTKETALRSEDPPKSAAIQTSPPRPAPVSTETPCPALTKQQLERMNTLRLRTRCKTVGLDDSGSRSCLLRRLLRHEERNKRHEVESSIEDDEGEEVPTAARQKSKPSKTVARPASEESPTAGGNSRKVRKKTGNKSTKRSRHLRTPSPRVDESPKGNRKKSKRTATPKTAETTSTTDSTMSTGRDTHEDAPTVRPPAVTCIRTSSLLNTGRSRKVAERHTEKSPTHRAEASREEVPTVGSAREATAVVKAEPIRREEASTALVKEECLGLRGAVVLPRGYAGRTRTGAVATECKTERVNDRVRIKTEPEVASPPSCDSIATVMGSLVVSSSTCSERGSTVCTGNDVGDSLEEGSREDGGVEEESRQGDRRAEEGRQGDRRVEEGREGDGGVEEEGRQGDGGVEEGREGDGGVEEEGRKGDGKSEDGKEGDRGREQSRDDGGADEDRGEDNMEVEEEEEGRDDGRADENGDEDDMEVEEEGSGVDKVILEKGGGPRVGESGVDGGVDVGAPPNTKPASGIIITNTTESTPALLPAVTASLPRQTIAVPQSDPRPSIADLKTPDKNNEAVLPDHNRSGGAWSRGGESFSHGSSKRGRSRSRGQRRRSPSSHRHSRQCSGRRRSSSHHQHYNRHHQHTRHGRSDHTRTASSSRRSEGSTSPRLWVSPKKIVLASAVRGASIPQAGTRDVRGGAVELGGSSQAGGQEKTVVGDKRDRVRISTSTAAVAKTCGKGSDSWSRTVVLNPRYSRTAVGSGTSTMSVGTTQVFDGRQGGWSGPWSNSYAPASACYSRSGGPSSVYSSFGRYAFTERIPPPPPPPPLPPPPAPPQSTTRWPPPPRGNSGISPSSQYYPSSRRYPSRN